MLLIVLRGEGGVANLVVWELNLNLGVLGSNPPPFVLSGFALGSLVFNSSTALCK